MRGGTTAFPCLPDAHFSSLPTSLILRHLLFLLRSRASPVEFLASRPNAPGSLLRRTAALASLGRASPRLFSVSSLVTPDGWVDTCPPLLGQSLAQLSSLVVANAIPASLPLSRLTLSSQQWSVSLWETFRVQLDLGPKLPYIWKLNVPQSLKELLWKSLFGALPLGATWRSRLSIGLDFCPCGDSAPLTLFHVFSGCSYFPVRPLYSRTLFPALWAASSHVKHLSTDPAHWYQRWWFPLLAFKNLAATAPDRTSRATLARSVHRREWIYGSFLWSLWKARMNLAHDSDFSFSLDALADDMQARFADAPP